VSNGFRLRVGGLHPAVVVGVSDESSFWCKTA